VERGRWPAGPGVAGATLGLAASGQLYDHGRQLGGVRADGGVGDGRGDGADAEREVAAGVAGGDAVLVCPGAPRGRGGGGGGHGLKDSDSEVETTVTVPSGLTWPD